MFKAERLKLPEDVVVTSPSRHYAVRLLDYVEEDTPPNPVLVSTARWITTSCLSIFRKGCVDEGCPQPSKP